MTAHAGEGDSSANVSNAPGKSSIVATNCSMENLAQLLGGRMDRVVTDYTGLKGGYDFSLTWTMTNRSPDSGGTAAEAVEPGGVDLFDAIRDQLGLKVEKRKVTIDRIVIDHVEKVPAAN